MRRIRIRDNRNTISLTHILILLLYLLSIFFVFSVAILESRLDSDMQSVCHTSIVVCWAFYTTCKAIMHVPSNHTPPIIPHKTNPHSYLFLIERNRILRAPYTSRLRDWLWLIGTTAVVVGFGSIAAVGFNQRLAYLAQPARRCWIGLPLHVTTTFLAFDVSLNLFVTLSFIYLTRHLVTRDLPCNNFPVSRFADWLGRTCSRGGQSPIQIRRENTLVAKQTECLLLKTVAGCVLVVLPTLANLVTMTFVGGVEPLWICFTACTLDGPSCVMI